MNRIAWPLLAAALSCGAGLPAAYAQRAAGGDSGLIDLSPQLYAVPDVPQDMPHPVPDAPVQRGLAQDAADDVVVLYEWAPYSALFPSRPAGVGLGAAADAALPANPADLFSPPPSRGLDAWSLGERHWRYLSSSGYGVLLGNTASSASAWGQAVPLAGVGLYRARPAGALAAGAWDYAVSAGALDAPTTHPAAEGDLNYGPVAADASVRYALDRDLSLATRLQRAPDLTALGLGGTYAMGDLGAWRAGVSGARQPNSAGWRRRLGYTLGLSPGLDLSWANMRQGAGYADLASYGSDGGCDCLSNQWQLDLAAGRWGTFSGSYERRLLSGDELEQQFGLVHGFRYGPYLKVRLETTRNLTSGDYGWAARFSLPLP